MMVLSLLNLFFPLIPNTPFSKNNLDITNYSFLTNLLHMIIHAKARRHNTPTGLSLITHWHCSYQSQFSNLYPTPLSTTTLCSGCHLNSNIIANKCTIFIPTNLATKLLCRINTDKTLNLHANFLDIAYSVAIRHPLYIPPPPLLTINLQQLPSIFEPCQLLDS